MNSRPIKLPGPDHPITITSTKGRVTVTVNGKRVADTHEALTLCQRRHRWAGSLDAGSGSCL